MLFELAELYLLKAITMNVLHQNATYKSVDYVVTITFMAKCYVKRLNEFRVMHCLVNAALYAFREPRNFSS